MVSGFQQALNEAVAGTLEEMFFSEASPSDLLWAKVRVVEPLEGAVTLAFPRLLAEEMAASLMGGEGQVPERVLLDALAELVNTVAGKFMSLLVSEDTAFKLSVPETGSGWPRRPGNNGMVQPFRVGKANFVALVEGEALLELGK